jgi:hypothetical protein
VAPPIVQRRSSRAGSRDRTDDLLITNQLLCQLSYAGFSGGADHTSDQDRQQRDFTRLLNPNCQGAAQKLLFLFPMCSLKIFVRTSKSKAKCETDANLAEIKALDARRSTI